MSSCGKVYLKVDGMSYGTCKSIVEEKIKKINGIRKIELNFITNVVMVEFDSTLLNRQVIEMNIDKARCKIMKLFV